MDLRAGFAELKAALPEPALVVERLLSGYTAEAVAESHEVQRRLLLPERRRPRITPSSILCWRAAFRHGTFFYTFGLRDELLTGWTEKDKRWQTGFIQHHGVVRGAGTYDANVEVHDQVHALYGLMWWPGITWEQFYIGARMSEALASYHYFFLDDIFEPRCERHDRIVDVSRILRLYTCDDCHRPENYYFNLPPDRARTLEQLALEYARQARLFYLNEICDMEREARYGLGYITRNPVNNVGNIADSLRYSYYMFPLINSRFMRPYLESLRGWQVARSLGEYAHRAAEIVRIMTGERVVPHDVPAQVPWRRRLFIAQDILLRAGLVMAQNELGLRRLETDEITVLLRICDRALEIVEECGPHTDPGAAPTSDDPARLDGRLRDLFLELRSALPREVEPGLTLGEALAAVGYDLDVALSAVAPSFPLAPDPEDATMVRRRLLRLWQENLPRTYDLAVRLGVDEELAEAFRCGPHRWQRTRVSEVDGRCLEFDEFCQRFISFLEERANRGEDSWASVLWERARLEYLFSRHAVLAPLEIDVRSPIRAASTGPVPGYLRFSRAAQLVESWLDLDELPESPQIKEALPPQPREGYYALTIRGSRPALVRLGPLVRRVRELLEQPLPESTLVEQLAARTGQDPSDLQAYIEALVDAGVLERFVPDPCDTELRAVAVHP